MTLESEKESSKTELITKEFLEGLINEPVSSFQVTAGSNHGDNFTSVLFAVEVSIPGKAEPLYLVIKTYPVSKSRQKFLQKTNLFRKEINVYQYFIPDLINFQRKYRTGDLIRPAVPPFLGGEAIDFTGAGETAAGVTFNPLDIFMAMVDLRQTWGFKMVEKHVGLDYAHTALVMKELAKIHALGWALKQKENLTTLVSKYPYLVDRCFTRDNVEVEAMLNSNVQLVEKIVAKYYEPDSKAMVGIGKLLKAGPIEMLNWFLPIDGMVDEGSIKEYLGLEGEDDDEPWMVSCHGDCWVNNFLFSYSDPNESENPAEVMFVDLQFFREGCPTTDLAYMFYSSTTYNTRKEYLNDLLELYHEQFLLACDALHVKPLKNFTLTNLVRRFHRAKIFGFLSATLVLPIILSEKASTTDLDTVRTEQEDTANEEDNQFSEMLKSLADNADGDPRLSGRFVEIVQEMVEYGIF